MKEENTVSKTLTLANKITILRIVLIPVVVISLLQGAPLAALAIFVLTALTDVLDGAAARWRREKSVLGRFLDPLADKLLLVFTYLTLAHMDLLPMWVFVVVFSRDLMIFLGWNIISTLTRNWDLSPRWPGKIATALQIAAVIVLLVAPLRPVLSFFLWAMIAATALSTLDYVWTGAKKLSAQA